MSPSALSRRLRDLGRARIVEQDERADYRLTAPGARLPAALLPLHGVAHFFYLFQGWRRHRAHQPDGAAVHPKREIVKKYGSMTSRWRTSRAKRFSVGSPATRHLAT
jgi:Mn-dependent DtxR family transcriptional regulator